MLFAPQEDSNQDESKKSQLLSFLLAGLAFSLFTYFVFAAADYHWDWSSIYEYRQKFVNGWLASLLVSLAALFVSLLVGAATVIIQKSRFLPLRYSATIYVELVRGTPLLVQILFLFYVVADSLGLDNRYVVGVAALSLFSGAYISEIFRGAIESVGKSQLQSAKAIGLTHYQTYRYVIFPQALRRSLPALAGQMANIIKDSSLLSIIAIREFTLNAREVSALTFSSFESYLPLALGYLILTLPIMRMARVIEKRIRFET
ncbi:MAG: amino acid ABC transporter permease [Verrucomicrobiota bacterium]